jgi:aminobenzoyl-glutamate transport protein
LTPEVVRVIICLFFLAIWRKEAEMTMDRSLPEICRGGAIFFPPCDSPRISSLSYRAQFTYRDFPDEGGAFTEVLQEVARLEFLNSVTLLLAFILIGLLLSIPVPNILPKWAIMAPVFIPLFMKLGIDPEAVLAAYRVSDSPPNVINPLLPHFALVVGFARRWQHDAGVGTVVATMLPYAAATMIAWLILFLAWYLFDLPFGPAT